MDPTSTSADQAALAQQARQQLEPLLTVLRQGQLGELAAWVDRIFAPDASLHLFHPVGDLVGPAALQSQLLTPLVQALPDLERRDQIIIAGTPPGRDPKQAGVWIGCAGHYLGTFTQQLWGIPPTGHVVQVRYHEFYRLHAGRVVEMQAIWDLPDLMQQAAAWPLGPSLGRDGISPAPQTQDGLAWRQDVADHSTEAAGWVEAMLQALGRSREGVAAMQLERFWHPHFNWYGPAGIGASRGIAGFRNWHQIPFLAAMPDRRAFVDASNGAAHGHLFGDGLYVGFTGWPGMTMTLTGDGFLGLAPAGQAMTMRSLDFWRCERRADGGLCIRENWVLIDLLDFFRQAGVDLLDRMQRLTAHRR